MPASTTLRGSVLAWAMLLGSLLAPSSIAQVPLPLEQRTGHPYEVLNYNYTEYTMDLEKRPYWLVIYNQGPTPTEYWVQRNGRTIYHGTACCDGGTEVQIPEAGTYTVQLNGKGVFALVRKELMDSFTQPVGNLNVTAAERLGFGALRKTKADHFCLDTGGPVDVDVYTMERFRLLETHRNVTRLRGVYDTSWTFLVVFVRLSQPSWVNATIAKDNCELTASNAGPMSPPPPSVFPVPGWGFGVALAGLLVGALLARRRAG